MSCRPLYDRRGEERLGKAQERCRVDPAEQDREDLDREKPMVVLNHTTMGVVKD